MPRGKILQMYNFPQIKLYKLALLITVAEQIGPSIQRQLFMWFDTRYRPIKILLAKN